MEAETRTQTKQIVIPVLDDIQRSTAEELDEHLMLFEYSSTVTYLKKRMRMAAGRAQRYVRAAR